MKKNGQTLGRSRIDAGGNICTRYEPSTTIASHNRLSSSLFPNSDVSYMYTFRCKKKLLSASEKEKEKTRECDDVKRLFVVASNSEFVRPVSAW
jgi:hypothetical protein